MPFPEVKRSPGKGIVVAVNTLPAVITHCLKPIHRVHSRVEDSGLIQGVQSASFFARYVAYRVTRALLCHAVQVRHTIGLQKE